MDNLRLVILLIGVVFLAIIYLWDRRRRSQRDEWELPPDADLSGERVEPEVTKPEDEWEIVPRNSARRDKLEERELEGMRGFGAKSEPLGDDIPTLTDVVSKGEVPSELPELVMALTIITDKEHPIAGPLLLDVTRQAGMSFGAHSIFHRMSGDTPLFSLANILEPGTFDLSAIDKFSTPGVALFLRLPGKAAGSSAMLQMVDVARMMAKRFNGRLCDERRQPLSEQGIARLLDKARPYRATSKPE